MPEGGLSLSSLAARPPLHPAVGWIRQAAASVSTWVLGTSPGHLWSLPHVNTSPPGAHLFLLAFCLGTCRRQTPQTSAQNTPSQPSVCGCHHPGCCLAVPSVTALGSLAFHFARTASMSCPKSPCHQRQPSLALAPTPTPPASSETFCLCVCHLGSVPGSQSPLQGDTSGGCLTATLPPPATQLPMPGLRSRLGVTLCLFCACPRKSLCAAWFFALLYLKSK